MQDHVIDVNEASFSDDVITPSHERPIVVDFWAPWCAPCRAMTPTLQRLAEEYAGAFVLAKVNTDENPGLAAAYSIRSIPAIKIFRKSEVVDEFVGVYPQSAIKAIIDKHVQRPSDRILGDSLALIESGDTSGGLQLMRAAITEDPGNHRLYAPLAETLIRQAEFEEADTVLLRLPTARQMDDDIQKLFVLSRYGQLAETFPEAEILQKTLEQEPNSSSVRYQLSVRQIAAGRFQDALDNLLLIVRNDRRFQDDAARKTVLDVFTLLGNTGPLVHEYRGLLSKAIN